MFGRNEDEVIVMIIGDNIQTMRKPKQNGSCCNYDNKMFNAHLI